MHRDSRRKSRQFYCSLPSLERLEAKGLFVSELGQPLQERGGRAARYFRISEKGLHQTEATRQVLTALWRGQPTFEGGRA
jgi:PadR family transcriptional regulator PadR